MDPCHPSHVDPCNPKELHLLWVEPALGQVVAALKPLVRRFTLLESDVPSCLQLSKQSVDVLLGDLIHLLAERLVDGFQILQVFVLVVHSALDQSFLALQVTNQLVVV